MATRYSFVTIWRFDAPINAVWDKIIDSEHWPQWWKYVQSVTELEPGDENGVGSLKHVTWTTALPYRLSFDSRVTRVEKPHIIEAVAMGELNGTARWQLSQEGFVTTVRYDWNVSTSKSWMNLLAPIARPIFAWNHDILLNEGGKSLARLLHARLLDAAPQKSVGVPRVLAILGIATFLDRHKKKMLRFSQRSVYVFTIVFKPFSIPSTALSFICCLLRFNHDELSES